MTIMWQPAWRVLLSNRVPQIIVRENYRLLEGMGEPVYLLQKGHEATVARDKTVTFTGDRMILDPSNGYYYYILWQAGNPVSSYPNVNRCTVTLGGNTLTNIAMVDFITDNTSFAPVVIKNNTDQGINLQVRLYFNSPLAVAANSFNVAYETISPDYDALYRQVDGFQNSEGNPFGWQQVKWRGCYYKDKFFDKAFLLAMPNLMRDLNMKPVGWEITSMYTDNWTSPPPLCPLLYEHDIVVRLNGLRYEVRNMTPDTVENILVQQEFDLSEIEPSRAEYGVPVETANGTLSGFPEKIYSGF